METTAYKLTDVCDFQGGTQPPKEEWIDQPQEGYVRMLQIRDFTQGKAEFVEYVKDTKKLNKCSADDILIGRYGASVGKILTGLEGAYNVAIMKTIPDETKLLKKYLYYILNGGEFQNFIKTGIGARAAQAGFSKDDLKYFNLHLPSLEDQERIIIVLTQAEALIKQRKESIPLLDDVLESTFLKMFGDPVRNEKEWEISSLSKFGSLKNGLNYTRNETGISIRCLGVGDFKDLSKLTDIKSLQMLNLSVAPNDEYYLKNEDLVFVRSNGNRELVGRCLLVFPNSEKVTYSGFCIRYRIEKEGVIPTFLSHLFRVSTFRTSMLEGGRGANIQNISQQTLERLKIPIPPIKLQTQFSQIVEKIEALKTQLQSSLQELENLYGSLSQRAFLGKLNINTKIEIKGTIKVQPKITAEVVIDKINKELADFHKSIPNSGAPADIDNTLKQLDAELKIRGEIPFWEEYVKHRIIKATFSGSFTFEEFWNEFIKVPFDEPQSYDNIKNLVFSWLKTDNPFLKQRFNESSKQIELSVNETA